MNKNVLQVPYCGHKTVSIPLLDHYRLSYLPLTLFLNNSVNEIEENDDNRCYKTQKNDKTNTMDIKSAVDDVAKLNPSCESTIINGNSAKIPWKDMKDIANNVRRNVCGHSDFSDVKLLLDQNKWLAPEVEKYLEDVMQLCTACRLTAKPQASRKF